MKPLKIPDTKVMPEDPLSILLSLLNSNISANPDDWKSRKEYARLLYDSGKTLEAAELVWSAPAIPGIDLEIGFAVKILSKGTPRRAIRLLTHLQQANEGKPVQNMALANALLHHGMVMQAARFYGAAIQVDPSLVNPSLEHFLLWVDDSEKLWGNFEDQPQLFEELPWIKRETKEEAKRIAAFKSGHTTPVKIPGLARVPGEIGSNPLYTPDPRLNRPVPLPPAVTIPMDRVDEKDLILDNVNGANSSHVDSCIVAPTGEADMNQFQDQAAAEPESAPELDTDSNRIFPVNSQFLVRGNKVIRSRLSIDPREGMPLIIRKRKS